MGLFWGVGFLGVGVEVEGGFAEKVSRAYRIHLNLRSLQRENSALGGGRHGVLDDADRLSNSGCERVGCHPAHLSSLTRIKDTHESLRRPRVSRGATSPLGLCKHADWSHGPPGHSWNSRVSRQHGRHGSHGPRFDHARAPRRYWPHGPCFDNARAPRRRWANRPQG